MKVRAIAEEVRQVMAANPKIVDPHLDWSEQVKSIRLEVDQDRARAFGLTPQDVAQTLQTLVSGYTVTQYREGIEHIDVIARAVAAERLELNRLPALTIATRNGVAVPLSQIARLNLRIRGTDPVASQSRHGADGARRHRRPRAGAGRQQGGGAEAQGHRRTPCPTAIASRPADRSRRASRPMARWSPCSRSWRS